MSKSSVSLSRRQFLTLAAVAALLRPCGAVAAGIHPRQAAYTAEVGLLYDTISFRLDGTVHEAVDRAAGRYEVRVVGEGDGIANRIESAGRLRAGRWTPDRAASWFLVKGRESRSEITYDWTSRRIHYRFRGETFFLRRLRVVEDSVTIPQAAHVDDVMSAVFNYADGQWPPAPDGTYRTQVVRRRKRDNEGPDDVDKNAGAELVPLDLKIERDAQTGKNAATFDMTRFSSWAHRDRPGRIVFGPNRRPELIASSLILGTSVTIRFKDA